MTVLGRGCAVGKGEANKRKGGKLQMANSMYVDLQISPPAFSRVYFHANVCNLSG